MSVARKLVAIPNALESTWVIFTVLSGFTFNVFNPFSPPPGVTYNAPTWLLPLVFLQLALAVTILGVTIGCMFESPVAYSFGALCSATMLVSFVPIFVPINFFFLAAVIFSVFALFLDLIALGTARKEGLFQAQRSAPLSRK